VCIVTPGQIGSNPRVVKEAQALHEQGFEVTVIATRTLDLVEPRDQSLMRRIPWRLERLDLRSKWRWRINRAMQMAHRQAYAATGLTSLADSGLSAFTRPLKAEALRTPADLYIAHYPAALPAAAAAARRHGGRYAYDAEDFHLGECPERPEYDIERRLVQGIERQYLPECAHVTAASPGIADAYLTTYGIRRPNVVLNVFPLAQAPPGPTTRGTLDAGPSLYWFSQTIGPDRGLECAVRAIGLSRARPHLYLRGMPMARFVDRLREIAGGSDATDRLHVLPPDEPDRMERLAAAYDVGLSCEPGGTMNNRIALGNKLFSYLLGGMPVIMSDIPAHRRFAAEAGNSAFLYDVDDAETLASVMDRLLRDPERLAAARAEAFRLGRDRYNWEREKGALLVTVTQSLALSRNQAAPPMRSDVISRPSTGDT
jgi:glycosyltransferase involved in cell wall biosynthesis